MMDNLDNVMFTAFTYLIFFPIISVMDNWKSEIKQPGGNITKVLKQLNVLVLRNPLNFKNRHQQTSTS